MMTRRRVFAYVDAEPFRPFRIKMTSGETFDIRHPEMIFVSRTTARVHEWKDENADGAGAREREISILIIESIEPMNAAVKQDQD